MVFKAVSLGLSLSLILVAAATAAETDPCDLPAYCTPDQAIACVRKAKFSPAYYKNITDDIINLLDPYVFMDILKNPPEVEGMPGYFTPVDLIAALRGIDTNAECFYDFYKSIKRVINSVHDGHLSYFFSGNDNYDHRLFSFFSHLPMDLATISDADGNAKVVAQVLSNSTYYEHFPNGASIRAMVEKNAGVGVASINGKAPQDFMLEFGHEYYNFLKNRDAQYTYAQAYFSQAMPLYDFPLEPSDFKGIKIVYENGDNFTTDFLFMNTDSGKKNSENNGASMSLTFTEYVRKHAREIAVQAGRIDLNKIRREWEEEKEEEEKKRKSIEEVKDHRKNERRYRTERELSEELMNLDIEEIVKEVEQKQEQKQQQKRSDEFWDYSTEDGIFKCRVDDKNEVDVIFINSFYPDSTKDFTKVSLNCNKLFVKNNYTIILISDLNTGGMVALASYLQMLLQGDAVTRNYVSYRDNAKTRKMLKGLDYYAAIDHRDTCKPFASIDEMYADAEVDDLGNGTLHRRSAPALLTELQISVLELALEKEQTLDRKPTEIVVFTDSFSFSAGCMLTKGLKESGSAIIAGYNGYPGSPKESFDIGQSPTNCIQGGYEELDADAYERLDQNGVVFASISVGESFRVDDVLKRKSPNETLIPREFMLDPPDERTTIYGAYDDERYDEFVRAGKAIAKKYETECNPNNPHLHLRDSACDTVINKTHMHGGRTCGSDGKWSSKCEGYYCDAGFFYDSNSESCIEDVCYTEAINYNNNIAIGVAVIIVIVILIVLVIVGIIICVCCVIIRKRRKYKNVEMQYQRDYGDPEDPAPFTTQV